MLHDVSLPASIDNGRKTLSQRVTAPPRGWLSGMRGAQTKRNLGPGSAEIFLDFALKLGR
jgi:hypothetical protein